MRTAQITPGYNCVFSFLQVGKVGSNKMYIWDILRLPRHAEGHLPNYKVDSVWSRLVNDVRWSIIYIYRLGKTFAIFFFLLYHYSNIVKLVNWFHFVLTKLGIA